VMTVVELVTLALHAVIAAPSCPLWLCLTGFIVAAGMLALFYERCRRRTYLTVLDAIQPGTFLLDRTHRRGEITVIHWPQPRWIAHSSSTSVESH
jgi:hypothetical protein